MALVEKFRNECVGCPNGCDNCGAKRASYFVKVCDLCCKEVSILYNTDCGSSYCEDCTKSLLKEKCAELISTDRGFFLELLEFFDFYETDE